MLETGERLGTPEEAAGIAGMLCSADSQYCAGQVVCANGGVAMVR